MNPSGLTDEEASRLVNVEICGIMTHPPYVYVHWVETFLLAAHQKDRLSRTGSNLDREMYDATLAKVNALKKQMDRLFPVK